MKALYLASFVGVLTALSLTSIPAFAQQYSGLCGELKSSYGPFDYRTAPSDEKALVEGAHFTPSIESLRKPNPSNTFGGDIHYTLAVFPNHARALDAMNRLSDRLGTTTPPGAKFPIECYFDRAVRFAPDDAMIRVLYGNYLAKRNRVSEAREQLELAETHGEKDPFVTYNLGLAYLELKDYDKAIAFARKAEEMGVGFPGLRDRLRHAGKWPN